MRRKTPSGFTLIEAAVVLLILGVLVAGVLRGQELLTAARVRGVIQEQEGLRTAYFGFQDRYQALPGDYPNATATLAGVSLACGVAGSPGNGNGNRQVQAIDGEHILLWDHLSKANFLSARYTCEGNNTVNPNTVPRNRYGQFVQLLYDANYAGIARIRHNLKTGNDIPSDVLAEVDRKIDDGNALTGTFRGSTYTTGAATDAACWNAAGIWSSTASISNCGGAMVF
jgi:prepilin-type N-terminal cleavage/methylation domain-containing protein